MGSKSPPPPPPVIVIPPPPPPPEVVETGTPEETYKAAADSLSRAQQQRQAYQDRWNKRGLGHEDIGLRHAQIELDAAKRSERMHTGPSLRGRTTQEEAEGESMLNAAKDFVGSLKDDNVKEGEGTWDRLGEAEKAINVAKNYKTQVENQREVGTQQENPAPAWANTNWLDIRKPYDDYNRENKIPYEDPGPQIYEIRDGKKVPVASVEE